QASAGAVASARRDLNLAAIKKPAIDHSVAGFLHILKCGLGQCGSWLACDGGLSVYLFLAGPPLSQASQLPH
ncbi:hypothetical protein KIN13_22440, partial [Vibrio cholerae]